MDDNNDEKSTEEILEELENDSEFAVLREQRLEQLKRM